MFYLSKRAKNYVEKRTEESGNITYIYDEKWVKKRWKNKEKKIKQLEKNVSDLLKKIKEDLKSDDDETRQTALAVSLIYDTKERIGNDYSAEERKHYGVTTWLVKHITFSGGKAKIKYVGKSGVDQEKIVEDKNIVSALKDVIKDKKKNDNVFTITPKMVNKYLKKFKITAKDIRGAEANNLLKKELKKQRKGKLPKEEKEKTKKLKEELNNALENVAENLGHQSSTLKNQYILPNTIETYLSSGKIASLKEELPPWENDEDEDELSFWKDDEYNEDEDEFLFWRDKPKVPKHLDEELQKWNPHKSASFHLSKRANELNEEQFNENNEYEEVLEKAKNNPLDFFLYDYHTIKEYQKLEEIAAESLLLKGYTESFLSLKLYVKYPRLGKPIVEKLAKEDPYNFFIYELHKKYPKLGEVAARTLVKQQDSLYYFFKVFKLHEIYPELGKMFAIKLVDNNTFFEYGLHKIYPVIGKIAAKRIIEKDPYNFFFYGLHKLKEHSELEDIATKKLAKKDPYNFFDYGLHKKEKYYKLGEFAAKSLLSKNDAESIDDFLSFNLHKIYPGLEMTVLKIILKQRNISAFFEYGFNEKYLSLADEILRKLPEGFVSDQDINKDFYFLSKSFYQTEQRPNETKNLMLYDFSLNNSTKKESDRLEKEILTSISHQSGEDIHSVGLPGYTKSFGLVSFPNKQEIVIEEIQSDLPPILYYINNNKEEKKKIKEKYGEEQHKNFMNKYAKHSLLYPYLILENIVDFAMLNNINTIKLSTFDNVMKFAEIGNEKKAKKIYEEIPEKLGFEKQGNFYVYNKDLKSLKSKINSLKQQELQPKQQRNIQISKIDKRELNLEQIKQKINEVLGERSSLINISPNLSSIMKSINVAFKNKQISKNEKNILVSSIPKMVIASLDEMMMKIAMYVDNKFHLSKRAEFNEILDKILKAIPKPLPSGFNIDVSNNEILISNNSKSYSFRIETIKDDKILITLIDEYIYGSEHYPNFETSMFSLSDKNVFKKITDRINKIFDLFFKGIKDEDIYDEEHDENEWKIFCNNLIKYGKANFPETNLPSWVPKYLNYKLPKDKIADYGYDEEENSEIIVLIDRDIGYGPQEGYWIHVVNTQINSFKDYINSFKNIYGEICVSEVIDNLFHTRKDFLGIIIKGKTTATFNKDVHSAIDRFTGRRFSTGMSGSKRIEGWIVPSNNQIYAIATDIPEFMKEAEELGYKVFFKGEKEFSILNENINKDIINEEDYYEYPEQYKGTGLFKEKSFKKGEYVVKLKKFIDENDSFIFKYDYFTKFNSFSLPFEGKSNIIIFHLESPLALETLKKDPLVEFINFSKPKQLSFKLSKRAQQVYTKNSKDKEYSVDMLIEITKNNKIENIPISYIEWNLDEKIWDNKTSPRMVLENPNKYKDDAKRIEDAELKYPILIYGGEVVDGYHRLAKAFKNNKKLIKARIITDKQLDASRIDKERVKELKAFKLSKRAGPQILIEPYDSAVARAYHDLPPDIKNSINKIIVHPEGGVGQLGHVEMGQGKDPQEVHIFKNRILEQVRKMFGTSQPNAQQLEDAIHMSLIETLIHEGVHIGPEFQVQAPYYRFKEEPLTEQETKRRMNIKFPELSRANQKLDEIKIKYSLDKTASPDLEFIAYCKLNKEYDIVKKGISLIKQGSVNNIQDTIDYNSSRINSNITKMGFSNTPNGLIDLVCWKLKNDLTPNGKFDEETLNKIAETLDKFPRNFGIVVPKKLYRGGMIDDMEQLKELKDIGVERVISLHNNPEITRMCNEVGLEHISAPIETGSPEEYGRKILGNDVSKLLLEKPTYIHCWFGADRTGGVIAKFRTENGWTNKDAYLEAKKYGFKDFFADLIDWFSQNGEPPVDTKLIRMKIQNPYENPEIKEQDAFTPTPTDQPIFPQTEPYYERLSDIKNNVNPIMSLNPPASIR